jgi:XTP/dITP diphosphohydrolase
VSTAPLRLVLASANPDKVAEIAAVLGDTSVELLARPSEVPDVSRTGPRCWTTPGSRRGRWSRPPGLPAVADDTGLEVDALGGAPGVYSARYAGEDVTYADNVAKLLTELDALPDAGGGRAARFRTVALVAYPDGTEVWREGVVEGTIAPQAMGSGGFGYDPVFVPAEGGGRTFADMTPDEKHAISHRGRAFRSLAEALARSRRRLSRAGGDVRRRQASSGAALARAARIICTPLVSESRIS